MTHQPRPSTVAFRPDGSSYMVDEAGHPVPDDQQVVLPAAELARMVAGYTSAAVAAERQSASKSTAELIQTAVDATAQSVAQRAFVAGQQYTAAEITAKSRLRRVVERDANNQITSIVDVREPLPEKPEKRIGFHPRRPTKEPE